MASLTIRKLDERLKQRLRVLAAGNGRSVEEDIRQILKTAAGPDRPAAPPAPSAPAPHRDPEPAAPREPEIAGPAARGSRVLLIIGGGIAAFKSLDLVRRLRERGMRVRCILTAAAQEFITALSAGALSGERVFTDLFDAVSEFD